MRSSVSRTFSMGTIFTKGTTYSKPEVTSKDNGKEKSVEPSKDKPNPMKPSQLDKKCFKCHDYGHFQVNCPSKKVMTLKEI